MAWVLWMMIWVSVSGTTDDVDFAELRRRVLPTAIERWQTIPWQTDLAGARRDARRAGKLLFLWAMNGHPCGST